MCEADIPLKAETAVIARVTHQHAPLRPALPQTPEPCLDQRRPDPLAAQIDARRHRAQRKQPLRIPVDAHGGKRNVTHPLAAAFGHQGQRHIPVRPQPLQDRSLRAGTERPVGKRPLHKREHLRNVALALLAHGNGALRICSVRHVQRVLFPVHTCLYTHPMFRRTATFFRLLRTGWVLSRHDAMVPREYEAFVPWYTKVLGVLSRLLAFNFTRAKGNPGERLADALTELGPAYIKFGQVLSTRADLFEDDFVRGLSKLKDKVPPFPQATALQSLEREWGTPWQTHLASISEPVAAASIAQVHKAQLHSGEWVAVKILRPDIERRMRRDMDVLDMLASLARRLSPYMRRLRPKEFVETARRAVMLELDLRLEAAAASEMTEAAEETGLFAVPGIHWELGGKTVMVTEWIDGLALSDDRILTDPAYDREDIARRVMQTFLACSFDYGVFHADMHEGNMIVRPNGELVLLDFGILGRLSMREQRFHTEILFGFIRRDYHRIAEIHFEAGYVPEQHSIEDFASALRAVGEPIWGKNASEVPMHKVLLHLFEITEIFDMPMQPQLIMLQKTMMQSEGVCRRLDPDFDMWAVARPIVENSIRGQYGLESQIGGVLHNLRQAKRVLDTLPGATENIAKLAQAWSDGEIDLSGRVQVVEKNGGWETFGKGAALVGAGAAVALGLQAAAAAWW